MRLFFNSAQPLMFMKFVKSQSGRHSKGGEVCCFLQQWSFPLGPKDTIFFFNQEFRNKINVFLMCMETEAKDI